MGKKIVILNGSPRPKGNTAGLVEAFTQGAEQAGASVTTFVLDRMDIHGCKGCYGGGKDPASPCVQKDDMEKIYPAYREADVVVLASPLYYWRMSGQLYTAFDRLFAVTEADGYGADKRDAVLLMAAEGDEFEDVVEAYEKLMGHMGWRSLGTVLAGGVGQVGDIAGKPQLDEARRLGATVAQG